MICYIILTVKNCTRRYYIYRSNSNNRHSCPTITLETLLFKLERCNTCRLLHDGRITDNGQYFSSRPFQKNPTTIKLIGTEIKVLDLTKRIEML